MILPLDLESLLLLSTPGIEEAHVGGDDEILIRIATSPASDNWGFVGVVAVGDHEAYRTIRAYPAPGEALAATQRLLADVLGGLLAGQEWSAAQSEFGHSPRRTELEFGLRARSVDKVPPPPGDDSTQSG